MEGGGSALAFSSPGSRLSFHLVNSFSTSSSSTTRRHAQVASILCKPSKCRVLSLCPRSARLLLPAAVAAEAAEVALEELPPCVTSRKVDKSGRFCSPRAARELALLIAYGACLEGSDPVRLFDKRVNARRFPGYDFDKAALLEYDHMSFGGTPVNVGTEEEAEELMLKNERESALEAEVLSAPPKLVYNKFVLRMARDILEAVVTRWNQHVMVIDKIIPQSWKDEPASKIIELCILHLAMAEVTAMGTRHQIVINEAVDLAKRFCDGGAPRIINGCLRTFVKNHSSAEVS
ncbi:hypothetical protein Taro_037296 [Colocasia esculenta]|uniref:NusB/RsmB/TIM44 domain-containing protein n=1 Tax=Colocasia esculenta TaxID=4460 RepID=A0A843W9B6_COLES|nr:hypothetical protein [Colocasia esculenta]